MHHHSCTDGVIHLERGGGNSYSYNYMTQIAPTASLQTFSKKVTGLLYHVPQKVGHPVHQRTDAADKLQVFGLSDPLLDEVKDEAGRDEGHGENDTHGHHCIHGRAQAGERRNADPVRSERPGTRLNCRGTGGSLTR